MSESVESFYDDLATYYHLIFDDWNRSVERQAAVLGPILERATGRASPYVLDCACGIGTQALGLAERGHRLVGSDLSGAAIDRARTEAQQRQLNILFHVADMRDLSIIPEGSFDAVLVADNALPHLLSLGELESALAGMSAKLTDDGVLLATIRDYDHLAATRPAIQTPVFHEQKEGYRIVHQVWHWEGNEYALHHYLTIPTVQGWIVKHFASRYRALQRVELNNALRTSGFDNVEWLEPGETSFYQPIVLARKNRALGK
ncbi:MAG TPA: class I SAM-dependent methyltransferase [Silvibacterium sp.]|nr:class I SAM-dependent methyltransferase [Silvibacterium sp.]